jgi:hypothetical protein
MNITNIYVNDIVIDRVEQLTFVGSAVTLDGGALQNVQTRVKKAHGIFVELYPLLKNKNILMKTKILIVNSNVKSILLCGCETWEVTTQITNKLQSLLTDVCEEW